MPTLLWKLAEKTRDSVKSVTRKMPILLLTILTAPLSKNPTLGIWIYVLGIIEYFAHTGICWLRQWKEPRPQMMSVLSMPTISRLGKHSSRM